MADSTSEKISRPVRPAGFLRHSPWILLFLTVFVVAAVRWRLREMPLERDEGEYAYAGQLMLQGIPPYKLAYNMKLPGTYASYAAIMAVFGQSPSGIHLGFALVNAAAIVLVFFCGRRLLDEWAGVAAAVTYALTSLSVSVLGLQAHATHFVVLPALGALFIFLQASISGKLRSLFASGFLFGVAFVMKQHGVMFGVFGLFYLVWVRARVQRDQFAWSKIRARSVPFDRVKYGRELSVFAAGLALPYLLVCLFLGLAGVFHQFIFWTVQYANQYVSAVPLGNRSELFRDAVNVVASPNIMFWILAGLGGILMWGEKRLGKQKILLTALLICSCLSISIGFYFREHYFVLLLPALSLLAGVAVSRGVFLLKQSRTAERFLAAPTLGLFLIGVVSTVVSQGEVWLGLSPVKACRQIYGSSLFPQAVAIGDYLRTNSAPTATIAVLGSEPEIYFYSRRHSATGYIYMYPLMEAQEYAQKMQEEAIHEIESARPEYVVFVKEPHSWLRSAGSKENLFEWWPAYRAAHYELAHTFEIETEQHVSDETTDRPPKGTVDVYRRNTPDSASGR